MKQFGKQANQIRELVEINLELMEENVALKKQATYLQQQNDFLLGKGRPPAAPINPTLKAFFDGAIRERAEMLERNRAAFLKEIQEPSPLMRTKQEVLADLGLTERYEELMKAEQDNGTAESAG